MLSDAERYANDLVAFADLEPTGIGDRAYDPIAEAVRLGRYGLSISPFVLDGRDKRPALGGSWLQNATSRINEVVEDFEHAVSRHGAQNVLVGWALGRDGFNAMDDDHGLAASVAVVLDHPHAVNVTHRGRHLVFRNPGFEPSNSNAKFPDPSFGEFRGRGGCIIVAGVDRPGFDPTELERAGPFPFPEWLTPANESAPAADNATVTKFLAQHTDDLATDRLDHFIAKLNADPKVSRHERLIKYAGLFMRDARAGIVPAETARSALWDWWTASGIEADYPRTWETDFHRYIACAIGYANADTDNELADRRTKAERHLSLVSMLPGGVAASPPGTTAPNLPDEFWSARPVLAHVRQAAHSRTLSADAVIAGVLARVAAIVPPSITLPAIVGTVGTLDLLVATAAQSGRGKTTAARVAAELVPITDRDVVVDFQLGSGEGLVDAFLGQVDEVDERGEKRKVRRQVRRAVLAVVDEGQVLAELGSRRGSTILPTLRSAWSGQTLGQGNASADTNRRLDAGRYRVAAMLSFQPEHATGIIDDSAGGTLQRIIWFAGTDPMIPDQPPPWPDFLDLDLAHVHWHGLGHTMVAAEQVATEVRSRHLARARGEAVEADALDSHTDLCRLKIAGILAIIDGRLDITVDDWRLAGMVLDSSRRVRRTVIEYARSAAHRREEAGHARAAQREAVIADSAEVRALEAMAKAIARKTHRSTEPIDRRTATHATKGADRQRASVDDAIARAVEHEWITVEGDRIHPGESRPI